MKRSMYLVAALAAVVSNCFAQTVYDPMPWLADLSEMQGAFTSKYANFEWAVFDREVDMAALFADARKRIEAASSDTDATAAFDRLIRRIGDGHIELHWPQQGTRVVASQVPCADYDSGRAARPLAAYARGYVPIDTPLSKVFPIGVISSGRHRVGVLKIPLFAPSAFPSLCQAALEGLTIAADKPCDDACSDRIEEWAGAKLNEDFMVQLKVLEHAKIDTLLVDIAGNGGGTEWAEAAARTLTSIRLKSARMQFVRGAHWARQFGDLEGQLRAAAKEASADDRVTLLTFADEAETKKKIAETPCDATPLWDRRHPDCTWLGEGFFATGPLAAADPLTLRGKSWAAGVFSPMEFQYTEGLWKGPLIVLVDSGSGSAAEEFAALLQDNRAALIMGEPTVGVGCGHTDGGTPTTLSHRGAILMVPDCVRLRADGSNEMRGVMPDLLVGFHRTDGPHLRSEAFLLKLPEALQKVHRGQ